MICIGPNGQPLTLADLPRGDRWTAARKAVVVIAVRNGLITLEEAMTRYDISLTEFRSWEAKAIKFGVPGLRQTYTQGYKL
jgi:hypothetical protein